MATAPQTRPAPTEPLDELELLRVIGEVKSGDFTARMPAHWTGVVGTEGKLGGHGSSSTVEDDATIVRAIIDPALAREMS